MENSTKNRLGREVYRKARFKSNPSKLAVWPSRLVNPDCVFERARRTAMPMMKQMWTTTRAINTFVWTAYGSHLEIRRLDSSFLSDCGPGDVMVVSG